jgi:hypothetical protein
VSERYQRVMDWLCAAVLLMAACLGVSALILFWWVALAVLAQRSGG